jgi:hypothetical protein
MAINVQVPLVIEFDDQAHARYAEEHDVARADGQLPRARDMVTSVQEYALAELQASLGLQGPTIRLKR